MTAFQPAQLSSAALDMRQARPLQNQLLFIYGTGLGIGLHLALAHLFIFRTPAVSLYVLVSTLIYATLTLVLWQWVLPRFSHHPRLRRLTYQTLIAAVSVSLLSVGLVELGALFLPTRSMFELYTGGPIQVTISEQTIRWTPLISALIPIIPTVVICVVGFNQHWWRIFVLQGRQEELRELAVSAQLAALRAQVNPHFLFNSLNTIAQLISSDPAKAEACVERLAEIFRYMLSRAHLEFVPLAEELKVAEAYLEIERARFSDDLTVEKKIDERAKQVPLPGLILQPLVENAVKHGISRKIGGGRVTIEASLANGDLQLAVKDTGVGVASGRPIFERGVGLRNVRDRLVRLYGKEYAPVVTSREGEGTTVMLRIPVTQSSL
jgi:signal transduction histidine kinase